MQSSNFSPMDINQFEHESENYWAKAIDLCSYKKLEINDQFVSGYISYQFNKYPTELFENALESSNFSLEELRKEICPNFTVYPNPIKDQIFLRNTGNPNLIQELKLYSTTGQLLLNADPKQIQYGRITLPYLEEKLVILELKCGEEKLYQKLIVLSD